MKLTLLSYIWKWSPTSEGHNPRLPNTSCVCVCVWGDQRASNHHKWFKSLFLFVFPSWLKDGSQSHLCAPSWRQKTSSIVCWFSVISCKCPLFTAVHLLKRCRRGYELAHGHFKHVYKLFKMQSSDNYYLKLATCVGLFSIRKWSKLQPKLCFYSV